MANAGNRTVFVGNIPYGVTEEVIEELLGRAGQVLNFRLVHDRETGKPKGYGFAEYSDADSAASAVRNLNGTELNNRQLRVDYSNDGKDNAMHETGPPSRTNGQDGGAEGQTTELPPLPPGRELAPNLSAEDAISKTLETLPVPQLLDVMSQMKGLVTADPAKATQLFSTQPQLAYAIFQALLLLKLVDPQILAAILQAPVPPPQQAIPPQAPPQQYAPPTHQGYPHMPPQYGNVPTPQNAAPYQPPPSAPPPMQQQPPAPDRNALVQQLMALPQSEIDKLPPDQRVQIMTLRSQYGGQYGR